MGGVAHVDAVGHAAGRRMGRGGGGDRTTRMGRSPRRAWHSAGKSRASGSTRCDLLIERGWVQALPPRRRVFADSCSPGERLMPTLADLAPGQQAEVLSVSGDPALVQRLYEFGLLEGERVEV